MKSVQKTEITLYGELIIYSPDRRIIYQGKPDGYAVESACPTRGSNVVVLLKAAEKKHGSFDNLLLLHPDGTVHWRAELPDPSSGDAYVEFHLDDGKLFANSWSGYRVRIDIQNGKLMERKFTK